MSDEMDEINKQMKELEALKKRIEEKVDVEDRPPKPKKQVKPIKVRRTYEEEYEKDDPEVDPVSKYLGTPQQQPPQQPQQAQGIQQVKKQDKNFVHKRIAAQEVNKWIRKGVFIFMMNVIGFFVFYMMIVIRSGLLIDITMIAMVIVNCFFLASFRKHQLYLTRKYNIQTQGNFLVGGKIPTIRRYKPRQQQYQQPPQQYPQQQDPYDPPEYRGQGD
jgi:hypothetical protein